MCIFTEILKIHAASMKSMLKSERARMAGVSRKTLARWLAVHEEELNKRGYRRAMHLLPPNLVEYIMQEYGITDDC